jgi:two-component system, response regulator
MVNTEMPSASGKLLVIEDDKDQAAFISLILRECNWIQHIEIEYENDGGDALQYLTFPDVPNGTSTSQGLLSLPRLIILDLQLPNTHGLEVLKRVKSQALTKHIPIIVLTASYIASDLKKSYDLGAVCFLRKPIEPDQVIKALEYCLRS